MTEKARLYGEDALEGMMNGKDRLFKASYHEPDGTLVIKTMVGIDYKGKIWRMADEWRIIGPGKKALIPVLIEI